ncbi:MAG: hypothetical protein QM765_49275 [Myxococcales bacterium]
MQAGFIISIIAFFIGWIPFAGYLGVVAILLGVLGRAQYDREGNAKIIGTLAFGGLAVAAAAFWTYVAATASCPHVYAWDGKAWQLDADMLSGSLYRGAESDDVDRLESLASADGQYRVRIANDRQERDFVDAVALEVIDHPAGTAALPTPSNEVVLLGEQAAPLAAADARGRDLLAALAADDGASWQGNAADHDLAKEPRPRDAVELTLPPVQGPAYLVLRVRNTEVATEALYRYLASIGPGVGTLLSLAERDSKYPYQQRLADELERMGVPMTIEVSSSSGAEWQLAHKLKPIGPAALRSLAIPVDVEPGQPVRVRLSMVPVAWEIDRVAIATRSTALVARAQLSATSPEPETARLLAKPDGQRVELEQGAHVELRLRSPASTATRNRAHADAAHARLLRRPGRRTGVPEPGGARAAPDSAGRGGAVLPRIAAALGPSPASPSHTDWEARGRMLTAQGRSPHLLLNTSGVTRQSLRPSVRCSLPRCACRAQGRRRQRASFSPEQ